MKDGLSLANIEDRRRFHKENFDGKTQPRWLSDRNGDGTRDWRDPVVQKEGAFRLTDLDGDGTADQVQTLGEYHTEVTGSVSGVMAVGGNVFLRASEKLSSPS